ncbi:Hypothetical predicted protein [Olea europaea subsp. europaea]|uniref:Uncharacterized protein n=1 Tax=Olea europaea subsp. europaea TaxID=158383 RepID=A0A8S0RZX2_OLEEU|nr:Hypothetical predicted protein [Olea europaea subsp. europaea]
MSKFAVCTRIWGASAESYIKWIQLNVFMSIHVFIDTFTFIPCPKPLCMLSIHGLYCSPGHRSVVQRTGVRLSHALLAVQCGGSIPETWNWTPCRCSVQTALVS